MSPERRPNENIHQGERQTLAEIARRITEMLTQNASKQDALADAQRASFKDQQAIATKKQESRGVVAVQKDHRDSITEIPNSKAILSYEQQSTNVPDAQHLINTRAIIGAADLTSPSLRWTGVADPQAVTNTNVAEYMARISLLPEELRNDPNVLFHETARLAASDKSTEANRIVNRAINRIDELRNTQQMALDREETIRGLRGFVVYDADLDRNINPELASVLEKERRGLELPTASPEDELKTLGKSVDEIRKGVKDQDYTAEEASPFVERINEKIASVEEEKQQKQATIDLQRRATQIEQQDLGNKAESHIVLSDAIREQVRARHSIDPAEIIRGYDRLPDADKEMFVQDMRKQIRGSLDKLEEVSTQWSLRGLTPQETQLSGFMEVLRTIDHKEWEHLLHEVEAREWIHKYYFAYQKAGSPFEIKEIFREMSEYDSTEIHESITKMEGVAEAFSEIDKRADALMAAETDPDAKEKIIHEIKAVLTATNATKTEETGITVETAYRLAHRHYVESGRDAAKYREFIRKHKLIQFTEDNGNVKVIIDDRAPLKWDPLRMVYSPEVMWAFFQFGANTEGAKRRVILNGREVTILEAQGVGADVFRSLMKNGFDLCLQDFYSRRKDYILNAWIDGEYGDDKLAAAAPDRRIQLEKEKKIWSTATVELGQIDKAESTVIQVQQSALRMSKSYEFAEKYNTPVWTLGEMLLYTPEEIDQFVTDNLQGFNNKVAKLMKGATTAQRASLEEAQHIYTEAVNKAAVRNKQILLARELAHENKEFGDFIPSYEKFNIRDIPWDRLRRQHENVRGNFRDHFAALEVAQAVGNFINNPNLENFMAIDPDKMRGYTHYHLAQERLMIPAFLAFEDVQKGKGLLGFDFGLEAWRSKYGKVYDVQSITEEDMYKLGRMLVTKGRFSRDMLYKVRGQMAGLIRDKVLFYTDPQAMMVVMLALLQTQAQAIERDLLGAEVTPSRGGKH